MEYSLFEDLFESYRVLILIIMEDTHGEVWLTLTTTETGSLNPYYNGRYSWSLQG